MGSKTPLEMNTVNSKLYHSSLATSPETAGNGFLFRFESVTDLEKIKET